MRDKKGRFKKGHLATKGSFKKGHKPTEDIRAKIRIGLKRAYIEGRKTGFVKGHKIGISTRFKLGNKIRLGCKLTDEHKRKLRIATLKMIVEGRGNVFKKGNTMFKGRKHTSEAREKMNIATLKRIAEGRGHVFKKGDKYSFKKGHKLWRNPEFVKKVMNGMASKPNKAEKQLDVLICSITSDFKYNGDFSQGITIGGRVPDFVNINGRKQVIELFGDWFHSKEFAEHFNLKFVSVEDKIAHYGRYGFDCLVVWENELKHKEAVLNKINNFIASNSKN